MCRTASTTAQGELEPRHAAHCFSVRAPASTSCRAASCYRARRAGFAPSDIIFGGVGKTERELAEAMSAGVLLINAESEAEIRIIDAIARERRQVGARVGLRVNPEIAVETSHDYIKTGEKGHKFGIPYDEALGVAERTARLPEHRAGRRSTCTSARSCSRSMPYRVGSSG